MCDTKRPFGRVGVFLSTSHVILLGALTVGRRNVRGRQVGFFAEEILLHMPMETALAVRLTARRGHLARFEQLLEAANILAHDELRIRAEEHRKSAR
jgi:hypothetical protein